MSVAVPKTMWRIPNGTEVMVTVIRYHEGYTGSRLITRGVRAAGGRAQVEGRRFRLSPLWDGPGRYLVNVSIDESQRPGLTEALKRFPRRPSTFEFAGWGDELSGQLGPKLRDLDAVSRECLDMVARIEKLAANESAWVKEKRNVDARGADVILTKEAEEALKETARLMARLEKSDVKGLYPAAHGEMFFTLRTMHGNAQHFTYESGKFAGAKSYHSGGDAIKTHRVEPFNFENLKKYLGEVPSIAGREAALWMVSRWPTASRRRCPRIWRRSRPRSARGSDRLESHRDDDFMTCVGAILLVFALLTDCATFVYRSEAERVVVGLGRMFLWVGGSTCLVLGIAADWRSRVSPG